VSALNGSWEFHSEAEEHANGGASGIEAERITKNSPCDSRLMNYWLPLLRFVRVFRFLLRTAKIFPAAMTFCSSARRFPHQQTGMKELSARAI
jgi:hypothetical protein